jgi:hypothetical protein
MTRVARPCLATLPVRWDQPTLRRDAQIKPDGGDTGVPSHWAIRGHDRIAYGVPSCVISGDSMGSENSFNFPPMFESSGENAGYARPCGSTREVAAVSNACANISSLARVSRRRTAA